MSGGTGRQPVEWGAPTRPSRPSSPSSPRVTNDPLYRGRHRLDPEAPDTEETRIGPPMDDDADPVLNPATELGLEDDGPPPSSAWLSNYAVSLLRTVVPLVWGGAVSWLIARWPDAEALLDATGLTVSGPVVVTAVVTAAWYALWRRLEPHLPRFLAAVVLGHAAAPRYP